MPPITSLSKEQLVNFAQTPDAELRLTQDEQAGVQIETREGSWHGRLSRWIKTEFGEDRTDKRTEYRGAQQSVYNSLREIYGEEIGERAFRAGGFGHENPDGDWVTNSNVPLTSRHIQKMLDFAETELQRNSGISEWMGGVLKNDRDSTPNVLLGAKVNQEYGVVPTHEAISHIAGDMQQDVEKWLGESNDQHGFWIVDVGVNDGGHERIGIHVDRDDPNVLHVRGDNRESMVRKDQLGEWLLRYREENIAGQLKSMALYRAEQDTVSRLIDKHQNEFRGTLNGVTNWNDRGVHPWIKDALKDLEDGARLLRSHVSQPRDGLDLREQVNLQLGRVNRLLNDAYSVIGQQSYMDERRAFSELLSRVAREQFPPLNLGRELEKQVFKALFRESESFLGAMRANGGSLTQEGTRDALIDQVTGSLDRELKQAGVSDDTRKEICDRFRETLHTSLNQINEERLTPERARLEETIGPFCKELEHELQKQQAQLELRSEQLKPLQGIQVEMQEMELKGVLKSERSIPSGQSIDWRQGPDLHKPLPVELRFSREGNDVVANVPNLFSHGTGRTRSYESTNRRALTFEQLVEDHHTRLNGDKAGVPGRGKETETSLTLLQRMDSGGLGIKVQDGLPQQLTVGTAALFDLRDVRGPDGQPLNLTDEQFAGLTRFLDDGAFQAAYSQVVDRLFPPDTPKECREVGIIVNTSRGENGEPVFDITFRASLPDGEDLQYRALDRDGLVPMDAPTNEVETDDLRLSLTVHVPMSQLQENRPKVTIDQPSLVFLTVPEDYQTRFDIPPHSLSELTFEQRDDRLVSDVGDWVPDVKIENQYKMSFDMKLRVDDDMTMRGPRSENVSKFLSQDIYRRGGLSIKLGNEPPQPMEDPNQVVTQLEGVTVGDEQTPIARHTGAMLSRFMNVDVFDCYYNALLEQLSVRAPDEKPEVQFEIVGSFDLKGRQQYDITMRGKLPDSAGKGPNGESLDFTVGLRVPFDQLSVMVPNFEIIQPEIQTRPQ